ncbi:hypothetical protein WA158_000110 [Blastocystis sp. Blastoise]
MEEQTSHFKLVLLGDTAVGKSCLVVRFVRDEFFAFQEPTIGAAFLTKTININETTVKFEIWDTAGQERYRSLAPMYYRGAAAAIVVFDITSAESFNGAKSWVKELQRRGDPNVVIALVGNKCDLEESRQVSSDEASEYASENGLIFLEASAKTAQNVQDIFVQIAHKLPKGETKEAPSNVFTIKQAPVEEKKDCKC